MKPKEREFVLPGITLAGREWGAPGQLPVIAVHGWLDNAGSFDLLAPLLDGCHVLALDSAGHGYSSNRSPDAAYNLWQEVGDLVEVADQMGWPRFSAIGHSRGAAISTLLAGTFPDRIDRLVLVEGGVPILGTAEAAPENLARALTERKQLRGRSGRVYASRKAALEERANGFSSVSYAAAEILARRSLRPVDGGFRWHADQLLKASSEFRLTAEHVAAFISRIGSSVLAFLAEDSPFGNSSEYHELLNLFADIERVTLPGRHHFHLEGAEIEIARRIRKFLGLTSRD